MSIESVAVADELEEPALSIDEHAQTRAEIDRERVEKRVKMNG